jgi:1,4-dihydroxy-6-naphthoate synthase
VPGTLTTAFLALRLLSSDWAYEVVPFDQILTAVKDGRFDAGLIIHEGQLTFQNQGLHLVVDLGVWWQQKTGLPLPLGGNVVRRDLGAPTMREISWPTP